MESASTSESRFVSCVSLKTEATSWMWGQAEGLDSFGLSPAGMLSPALHGHRKCCQGMGASTPAITGKPWVNIFPAPLQADASILPPQVLILSAFKYQQAQKLAEVS